MKSKLLKSHSTLLLAAFFLFGSDAYAEKEGRRNGPPGRNDAILNFTPEGELIPNPDFGGGGTAIHLGSGETVQVTVEEPVPVASPVAVTVSPVVTPTVTNPVITSAAPVVPVVESPNTPPASLGEQPVVANVSAPAAEEPQRLTRKEIIERRREYLKRAQGREDLIAKVENQMPSAPELISTHVGQRPNSVDAPQLKALASESTALNSPKNDDPTQREELPGLAWDRKFDNLVSLAKKEGSDLDQILAEAVELKDGMSDGTEKQQITQLIDELRALRPGVAKSEAVEGGGQLTGAKYLPTRFDSQVATNLDKLGKSLLPSAAKNSDVAQTVAAASSSNGLPIAFGKGNPGTEAFSPEGRGMMISPQSPTAGVLSGSVGKSRSLSGLLASLKTRLPAAISQRKLVKRQIAQVGAPESQVSSATKPLSLARLVTIPNFSWGAAEKAMNSEKLRPWIANLGWLLLALFLAFRIVRVARRPVPQMVVAAPASATREEIEPEVSKKKRATAKFLGKSWLKRERRRALPKEDTNTRAIDPDLTNPMAEATRTIANFEKKRKEDMVAIAEEKTEIIKA